MKPLNEIRFWLCVCSIIVLIGTQGNSLPSGWEGAVCFVILIASGIWLGVHLTDLLVAFKKWWRE